MKSNAQQRAERLLNIKLPEAVNHIDYFYSKPNPDLQYFEAYLKFTGRKQDYDQFVRSLGMVYWENANEANEMLPADWGGPEDQQLSWWAADADTPPDAAARQFGVNGWIVAKYENDNIYVCITDSGSLEGTPGPW